MSDEQRKHLGHSRSSFVLASEMSEIQYELLNNPKVKTDQLLIELFCEWFDLSEEDIDYIKGLQS